MRQILDRRVVVTGLGLVTPLGTGVEKNWEALMAGRSGIAPITGFDVSDFPVKIAGEVKDFNPEDWIDKRDIKKMDLFIQYAIAAAEQAMRQSGFQITEENADNVGVLIGVGIGGLRTIEEYHKEFLKTGLKRITPFFIPKLIANLAPGQISIRYGARGPNFATTSACSSGSHAIGEAYRMVKMGYLDAAIAGGAEAALTSLGLGGFAVMRALSTRNDEPEKASRPFDKERDGFVMADGAAAMILEEREAALKRGRENPRRGMRLRHQLRRVSHHLALARRNRRGEVHADLFEGQRPRPQRSRLHQRARHLDAAGRHRRDAGDQERFSVSAPRRSASARPNR